MNAAQRKLRRAAAGYVFTDQAGCDRLDAEYWSSLTPEQRWAQLEQLRRMIYGYNPTAKRLQGFLEITQRPRRKISRHRRVGRSRARVRAANK